MNRLSPCEGRCRFGIDLRLHADKTDREMKIERDTPAMPEEESINSVTLV